MSSTMCKKLTEEQQKFLNSLEEEFKDRYTENDEEFKAVLKEELPLPPILENWRDFRQFNDRGGNDRNIYNCDRNLDHYSYDRRRYHHDDDRFSHSSRYVQRHRDYNHFQNRYRLY